MQSPSTDDSTAGGLTRRAALASTVAVLAGTAGCVGRIRDRFDPHTHHSDAALGDPPAPWPTLAHDTRRTAYRSDAPALAGEPTVNRVGPSSAFLQMPPTVAGDTVLAPVESNDGASLENGFVTRGIEDGPRWQDAREKAVTAPAVSGATAVLTSTGLTRAVSVETGDPHWEYAVGTGDSAPTVVGESVYVGGTHLVALDAVTGEQRWRSTDVPKWPGRTAATADTVFAAGESTLYALAAADGSIRWTAPLTAGTYDTPVVGEEVVVVTESNSTLRAVDRADGSVRWTVHLGDASQEAPAVADGRVFVVDDSADALRCFDEATGEERWRTSLGPVVSHRPAVGGDDVYVHGALWNRGVAVVDATTGEIRRIAPVPLDLASGVALADDAVFVAGQEADGRYGHYRVTPAN